jgi:dTDP-4-amino-4,6-dideoxygalactose transaminase
MAQTTVSVPFVDLHSHHEALLPDLRAAFERVVHRSSFILGDEVAGFEREFAAYAGATDAIGVSTGLDALRLALVALGVGNGDEVILPANTYIATALAVSACGATPVLTDVDERTFGIDPVLAEAAITARTKAIIPVHLYGQPCAIDAIVDLARRHHLAVVEDACQAHGARAGQRGCGAIGDAGCFSFYPSKNLGALGDGGMIVTSRDDVAAKVRLLRDYGQARKYHHTVKGFNARLDGLQAALLRVKLPHLDRANARRAAHAAAYTRQLAGLDGVRLPAQIDAPQHVYHLYVIRTRQRDELITHLAAAGVQTGIHYPVPIHLQEAYRDLAYREGAFPVTERLARDIVSLPMYPELSEEQIATVCGAIREFMGR